MGENERQLVQIKTHRDLTTERSVNLPDSQIPETKVYTRHLETIGSSNMGWPWVVL